MKITPKPITTHRDEPAIKMLAESPTVQLSPHRVDLAYQQLVTRQNVSPVWARRLLGLPEK